MVRISLLSLLLGAFAMCLVQPVQAGTAEAPEIQDGRFDVTGAAGASVCTGPLPSNPASSGACLPPASFADMISGWIDPALVTDADIVFTMDGPNNANVYGTGTYEFHFTVGGVDYVAGMSVAPSNLPSGGGAVSPTGVASKAEFVETLIVVTVPRASVGNPAPGALLTNLFLTGQNVAQGATFSDRAPNTGFGLEFALPGGAGNTTRPGDSDNDQLNDTCELEFYEDLNGTNNASADDDGDGLTNGQECAANPHTDPTDPDTDGDGVNDKDDPFPTDPTKGGATSGTSTSTNTGTGTGSRTSSTTGGGTGTRSSTGSGTNEEAGGEVKDLGDAVEKLQSDLDYLGTSAGGMVAVLILAIVALAVRWSL